MPVRKSTGIVEAIPTLPEFFDKRRLESGEFDRYIYEIPFKKSGKTVRGMSVDGYVHAMHPYLKSIKSELLYYGVAGEKRSILSCVVRATVTLSYRPNEDSDPVEITFEGLGDGDVQDVPTSGSLVRTVETRAINRALSRMSGISKSDLNNEFVGEEEYGTIAQTEIDDTKETRSYRESPQESKARKEAKYMNDGDELDSDIEKPVEEPVIDW
jgi:hypothetical protein